MPELILKPQREKSLLRRHPWVFAGAVDTIKGNPLSGDTVSLRAASGEWLASAAYSPSSQILARVWSWEESQLIDQNFFRQKIAHAIQQRGDLLPLTNAYRCINAESDGLPGLIVDRYANFFVCQFLTAGAEKWKKEIAEILLTYEGIAGVYERSDVDVREKEGLAQVVGVLGGAEPSERIETFETDIKFLIDIKHGHKTGFYLDQRENRAVVKQLTKDRAVLNCFCYTGAFSVAAWQGGAQSVVSLDSSAPALALAKKNLELNGLPSEGLTEGDVFTTLRKYRDSRQSFDLIILDPPKLAHTQAQIEKASRAYKDLNLLALKLLRPNGYLVTFSCSGAITLDLFQKILFGAALDAKREVQIVHYLHQASDHPVRLTFPEGAYLKGLVCRAA